MSGNSEANPAPHAPLTFPERLERLWVRQFGERPKWDAFENRLFRSALEIGRALQNSSPIIWVTGPFGPGASYPARVACEALGLTVERLDLGCMTPDDVAKVATRGREAVPAAPGVLLLENATRPHGEVRSSTFDVVERAARGEQAGTVMVIAESLPPPGLRTRAGGRMRVFDIKGVGISAWD